MKGKGESMLKGLKNKSPRDGDKSMRMGSASVNSDAVRSGVAKTPKTMGPREA
jgi:hypothetical protein